MADVEPLRALHYDLATAGALADLVAPPYDVLDAEQRSELAGRSPYNVVHIDLPIGGDPYADAAARLRDWRDDGVVVRDAEPALWAHEQRYTGPDRQERTRRGFFARVRVEDYGAGRIRPHERTHPGPKEDRLRLTRATQANLSPIFSLYSDPEAAAWSAIEPATHERPWGEVRDADGTLHRLWRVGEPLAIARAQEALRGVELLIADGHHRYETARVYAQEIGGEGDHRYVLMCLVALEDPGLEIFPTHRLVSGLDDARWAALDRAVETAFLASEVAPSDLAPPAGEGPLELGYIDRRTRRPMRLVLRDPASVAAALPSASAAYRRLDTGALEALLLKDALGLTDEDISHLHGFGYARDAEQAVARVESGEYDAAFLLRPTPVSQVRDVAAHGESMPPKSTYFFPKLLTGLLFNQLAP
ncbi:MAG TPA: DUF1015 domain-containing protein [Solirubrobacteraceae bacterium]|nr:DUF1015 domain-containing protein [Solirubrobacteraceae bacterium]